MAPKRTSPRPSLSRDDGQLSPSSHYIAQGMKFSPVPCEFKDGKRKFRLKLAGDNDHISELADLEDDLRSIGLTVRTTVIESIFSAIESVIPKYIARTGCAVRLGNLVMLKPYATGSIDKDNGVADGEKNHVEIRGTVCPSLRYALSKMRLINTVTHADGIDRVSCEFNYAKRNTVRDGEKHCIIGKNIYVPHSDSPDYGTKGSVWLETRSGERIGSFNVTVRFDEHSFEATLKLDREPESRECVLVVETYGTKAAADKGVGKKLRHSINVLLVKEEPGGGGVQGR